ncbi:MAG: TSUP family transporter [Acidobacteria bacterium]|nr:TSUP family transporter [Acidobacteriota bacterium]
MIALDGWGLVALFVAGSIAGTLNVVAGGGSFLTLPLMIFLGIPAGVANGTNRVALLLQNVGAVWGFRRHQVLETRLALRLALPAVVGAAIGSWMALQVSDFAFRRMLAVLMLGMALWSLLRPVPRDAPESEVLTEPGPLLMGIFFLIGIYGGFIQAGVGFLLLAGTTMAGLDLVRGNAVKVTCVLLWAFVTIAVFAGGGAIHWTAGLALGLGNLLGGQLGVRLTVLKGHVWIRAFVSVTIVLFALRLWLLG